MADLDSLSLPEQVALVVLVKALVVSDKEVSPEEAGHMNQIARTVGSDVMQRADMVNIRDNAALKAFLNTVPRQMAREVIYDELLAIAKSDGIEGSESDILDMVADAWDIVTLESHS